MILLLLALCCAWCTAFPLSSISSISLSSSEHLFKRQLFNGTFTDPTSKCTPLFLLFLSWLTNWLIVFEQVGTDSILLAIFLILTGLTLVFLGSRLFRPILFISGFYFFAVITYPILSAIDASKPFENRELVYLVSILVVGIVGGFLFCCFWKIGLSAIGALLGFTFGMFVLGLVNGGTITSSTGRIVFLAVVSVVGAIAIHYFERPILILGTAFPGSYAFFFGLDVFTKTGFNRAARAFLGGNIGYVVGNEVYYMIGGFLGLGLVGAIIQWKCCSRK